MRKTLEASFLFAGTIIGAGVLALPSVIAQTGAVYGTAMMLVVGVIVLLVALMFGEVVLKTKESHQLPGLAEKYVGRNAMKLAILFSVLSMYGALIAYIHGCGLVLSQMFGLPLGVTKLLFFVPMALITYFGIKGVEESETLMTTIMLACMLAITAGAFFFFDSSNIAFNDATKILLPVGILVFAFEGLPAIPQMSEVLGDEKRNLKKSIIIGFSIPLILYILFSIACIGALGTDISEVATLSLMKYGPIFGTFGNIFAIFAMATGFIALSNAISETYSEDMKINGKLSWALACFIPLIVLSIANVLLPKLNFTDIVSYTGILFTGPYYLITIYTYYKARNSMERVPEYKLKLPNFLTGIMMLLFIAFSAWALWSVVQPILPTII
jgi:tyrosine-specific transport protein